MRLPQPIPVQTLARELTAELRGDTGLLVHGINEIHHVQPGDLTFVDYAKYYQKALSSAASVVLIDQDVDCPSGKSLLIHPQPFEAYDQLVARYAPEAHLHENTAGLAHIHPQATIEPGAIIGPEVRIAKGVTVESGAILRGRVTVGRNSWIQSGAVVGSKAFYYKKSTAGYRRWTTGGDVRIEEQVDIGAGCTICAGVSSTTVIGAGSKLDGQVFIGHDTRLGQHCLLAGQVGIAGNCTIGDWVVMYGQVGVAQNIVIGDRAILLAQSGVNKNLPGDQSYIGTPVAEAFTRYREWVALRGLPDYFKHIGDQSM